VAGHFGLNLPAYLHATSPLRRYADLVNQRILAAVLQGEPLPYTSRDLETIADQMNAAEEEMKEAKLAYFRGTYDEQLRGLLAAGAPEQEASTRPLSELDAGHFHSVLRMAAEAQVLRPDVEHELLRRLNAQQLGAHDLFTVLFRFQQSGEVWERVKQASFGWLQSHPHYAPSLLVMGQQSLGWGEPEWETTPHGPGRTGNFQARALITIVGQKYTSSWYTSTQKARAKQAAGAELLARIAGVEIALVDHAAPESTQEASSVPVPSSKSEPGSPTARTQKLSNYKGQLQERTHGQGWDQPTYRELERAGPPHAPTFTVEASVTIDGRTHTAEGTGPTKIQAEQEASWRLLQVLPDSETGSVALLPRAATQAVNVLQELVQRNEIRSAAYSYEQAGPPHAPTFTCTCVVTALDGEIVQGQAQRSTKKAAAQAAAFQAVSALAQLKGSQAEHEQADSPPG
jgi:ribonuclease R